MKIHILSDLHLEFADFAMPKVCADVRVLAGDIHVKARGIPYVIRNSDLPTIYVAGNHEFYGNAIPKLYDRLRADAAGSNVHVLENEEVTIQDVRFLGCTLWTDFCLAGVESRELAMLEAKAEMNDYKKIRVNPSYRKLTPSATSSIHRTSVRWLESRLTVPHAGMTVVVTHHAPSAHSLDPNGAGSLINAAYASDLEALIKNHKINLWVHGHTHRCVDYKIGVTRIVSNQLGYPGETDPKFDPGLIVTI